MKGNLFIVGAMKAGTTSFNEMLAQHPEIYFSPIKEPNYFVNEIPKSIYQPSRFFNVETYFEKQFPESLHIAPIKELRHYEKLFSLSNEDDTYRAEGSTAYLHAPEAADLIYKYNPGAKIIILLRDPLKRAISHYKMDLGLGRTKESFQTEIEKDLEAFKNNKLSNWSYLGMSLYYENIKRYKDLFGEQVYILNFEELIKSKEDTLDKIFQFLSIKNMNLEIPHNNPTANLRFQKVLYFFKQLGLKDLFSFVFPTKLRHLIFKKLSKKEQLNIKITKGILADLNQFFYRDRKNQNS